MIFSKYFFSLCSTEYFETRGINSKMIRATSVLLHIFKPVSNRDSHIAKFRILNGCVRMIIVRNNII